jgi:membrane protease YdiL (CAAX protease family)
MKFNLKGLFIVLVAILASNTIFKSICLNSFDNCLECKIISKTFFVIVTLFLLKKVDLLHKLKPSKKTFLFLFISVSLLVLSFNQINSIYVQNSISIEMNKNIVFLWSTFSVGLFEEMFFRVFVFFVILQNTRGNLILSIILTSLLFGLAHLANIFNPEYVKISVINQILFAIALGVLFQSIYVRYKSLILISTLHCLTNYFGTYKRYLLNIGDNHDSYTFNDFISTFILIIFITIILIIPLSYLLIKKQLKDKTWHNNV